MDVGATGAVLRNEEAVAPVERLAVVGRHSGGAREAEALASLSNEKVVGERGRRTPRLLVRSRSRVGRTDLQRHADLPSYDPILPPP